MARILVIDDDPVIADLTRMVLDEEGFDVVAAADLVHVRPDHDPDCVVADLVTVTSYSSDSARHAVRLLRERFPGRPVVLVTAHAEAARDQLGVAEIVIKPFGVEALLTAVRRALATRPDRRASE